MYFYSVLAAIKRLPQSASLPLSAKRCFAIFSPGNFYGRGKRKRFLLCGYLNPEVPSYYKHAPGTVYLKRQSPRELCIWIYIFKIGLLSFWCPGIGRSFICNAQEIINTRIVNLWQFYLNFCWDISFSGLVIWIAHLGAVQLNCNVPLQKVSVLP